MSETTGLPALRCTGLGRRFGRRWALAHVDLTVAPGDSLLLAGPNGSGKSTLLRVVSGLLRPSQGSVSVFGHDPRGDRQAARSRLALVSHHLGLYPRLTAAETLQLWHRLGGDRLPRDRAGELLAEVGLEPHADLEVGGFSAGMRKRLALLRARLENPDLLLLDEPFSALDTAGRDWLRDWLLEQRERGVTLVLASHELKRAAAVCERGVRLEAGQMVWNGGSAELVRRES